MKLLPLCLLFILVVISIAQDTYDYVQLGTGTGVIQAKQSTDTSGTLAETTFCGDCEDQVWVLFKDSRFNGVFIQSLAYESLVWDSSGGLAVAGNPIILYKQKDTLEETKNQRWVSTSLNHFCLILNETFVAKHTSGHFSLAVSNKTDASQNIYIISSANVSQVSVVNYLQDTPPIYAIFTSSVAGKIGGELYDVGWQFSVPIGSWLMINDSNGVLLYNHTINGNVFNIAVPVVQFPVGPHQYTGYSTDGSDGASLTIIFSGVGNTSEGVVNGTGTDNFGAFTITQGYYNLAWYVNFVRQYASFGHLCSGQIDVTGTIISGTWQNVDSSQPGNGNYQYTLVA